MLLTQSFEFKKPFATMKTLAVFELKGIYVHTLKSFVNEGQTFVWSTELIEPIE